MLKESRSFSVPPSSRRGLPHLDDVHSFRALAIAAVVATHVIDYLETTDAESAANRFALSLFQNGSVLFVFIAGLLFQYLSAGFDYRSYLLNKWRFVIVPYLVASVPALTHQYVRRVGVFAPAHYHGNLLRTLLSSFVKATHLPRPLWFIPMIALFYLLAPVFIYFDRKTRSYVFLLPLTLLIAAFVHRPLPLNQPLHAFAYFLPAYLAGMATGRFYPHLRRWFARREVRWGLTALAFGLLTFEVVVLGRGGALWSRDTFFPLTFDTNLLLKLVSAVALLAWLSVSSRALHRRLSLIANLSFGVFFVHEYVLFAFSRLLPRLPSATLPYVLWGTGLVLGTSLLVVMATKRLSGRWSRYLIGC